MRRPLAMLLIGIIVGMAAMHFLQGRRLDEYYWQKEEIKVELYEATERLKKLQEQHEKLLPALVKDVRLEISSDEGTFIEPSLRRLIYDMTKELIGLELLALPYPLVYNILNDRIVENDKKKYHLAVEAVIIAETVVYYLKVTRIEDDTVAASIPAFCFCPG